MFFRQYELGCLSLFSYLIGDETTGRAVVVDPQRDVSQYLGDAVAHGLRIERVIETHFHADFLSGHLEIAAATGAAISYGEAAKTEFVMDPLADGQRLSLGEVSLEVRATPGHTPESICVVVSERDGDEPWGVLTGDTLFIGDVGRPDLLSSAGASAADLARSLYRSLHQKLLTLPDGVRVFPAHGAGSACGKNLSTATASTIGEQRATNYALQPMSEGDFVAAVTTGQAVAPPYFGFAARANRSEHKLLDDHEEPSRLGVEEVARWLADGAVLIDGRRPDEFASGHLRGAINVGLEGRFAEYAGDIARPDQPIVLVTDPGREGEAKVRLARIGFDRVVGAVGDVERVLAEHPEVVVLALRISARDFAGWDASDGPVQLVDVRNPGEQEGGVIPGARLVPLAALLRRIEELDPAMTTVVYCAGGYRSAIAASALSAHGFTLVADILGGYDAWKAAGFPTEAPAPSAAS
ncbi:MAG TPA: rhodanese-like domain-containing protein [Acidimicrobiia bacterium]|nr:rhodanese-like domain-containing protein [Acidimicrobiia bacterium]